MVNDQPAGIPGRELSRGAAIEVPASERRHRREILIAAVFLCSIVVLSLISYQARLGFYSDDWLFLSYMHNAPDQSVSGVFHALNQNQNIRVRPVQSGTLVLLYKLFHLSPLGYHIFNAAVLVCMALLLFFLLLELGQSVLLSAAIASLYILLPNYSTDRFWIAAFQADVSIAFYLLSFYSDLKSLRHSWPWKAVSLLSAALSVFAYEVAIPLFAINIGAVLWKGRFSRKARWTAFLTAAILAVCSVAKALINRRAVVLPHPYLHYVLWVYAHAVFVHFFRLGLALPHVVLQIIRHHLHPGALIASLITGLLVALLLVYLIRRSSEPLSQIGWKKVIGSGLVVFILGYAIFLTTNQVGFSTTGGANRIAIAAALGVAVCFAGVIGWFSSLFRVRLGKVVFCILFTALCAAETLVTNSIAYYWTRDYQKELAVQTSIFDSLPPLRPGTTLIEDGVCPFYGPAIILEAYWDASGIVRLHYHDQKLLGDVISPRIQVKNNGLLTSIYNTNHFYPYSPNLLLYNVQLHKRFVIRDRKVLQTYLSTYRAETNLNCPGVPGKGIPIF